MSLVQIVSSAIGSTRFDEPPEEIENQQPPLLGRATLYYQADSQHPECRIDCSRQRKLNQSQHSRRQMDSMKTVPFPLTETAGRVDALGARALANAVVALMATEVARTVANPFIFNTD